MPRKMGSEYGHRVIRIDVAVMSHFTHLNIRFTGFLALFMRSWYPTIIPKRGCALYTKLRSIHHFKGLDKGCVLYTGASVREGGDWQTKIDSEKGMFAIITDWFSFAQFAIIFWNKMLLFLELGLKWTLPSPRPLQKWMCVFCILPPLLPEFGDS